MTATEVFLPLLRDGGGDLINISSVAGRTATAGNAVYAATKWGSRRMALNEILLRPTAQSG